MIEENDNGRSVTGGDERADSSRPPDRVENYAKPAGTKAPEKTRNQIQNDDRAKAHTQSDYSYPEKRLGRYETKNGKGASRAREEKASS